VAERDPTLRRIERYSVMACVALAVTAGIATRRVAEALGVLGGGALVAISYSGIKAGISTVLGGGGVGDARDGDAGGGARPVAIGLVKFFTRYAILALAAYVIMARLRLPPVAVFAGASSLVIAVMVEALRGVAHGNGQSTSITSKNASRRD
jgi:hypothetical protein